MEVSMENLKACNDVSTSVMKELSRFHASDFLLDTLFITKDGQVWAHSIVLSAVSPFLKSLFSSVQDMVDDVFSVHLPDVESGHLHILLHLLYTGSTFIFRPELDSVKTLTGLLKIISISVTMAKQEWKSRHDIGKTNVHVLENSEIFYSKNQVSDNTQNEAHSISDKVKIEKEKYKSYQPTESGKIQSMTFSFLNHAVKQTQNHATEIQLIKSSSSDLDKFTMREFANKELNPLFEDSAVTNDANVTDREDRSGHLKDIGLKYSHERNNVSELDDVETEMEEGETVKEIQVYVAGNGEVTALQVLRDEEDLMECVDQDLTKDYEGLDRLATQSNLSRQEHEGEDNLEDTPGELEYAVTQIASLNPDAPFVIGNEGVIGLISVTEAFENTQKPDFNDVSNPVVQGTETETLIRKCPLCLKSVLGLHALGRHMKTAHPKLFGPYECPVSHCKRSHEDGTKVLSHMTQQHSKQASTVAGGKQGQHSDTCEIKCIICNIAVSSEEILDKHCLRFHGFSCHDPLQSDKQVYLCTEKDCNQRFRTCRSFAAHVKQVHKQKPWLCDECGKRFDIKQNYQNHTLLHGPKRQYVCDLCSKSYATPRLLYSHRALHLGRRFPCDQCSFVGKSNANLRGHKISVHGERKFSCDTCDKKFAIGTNLREHMKIHTGETPFHCEICDMSYKRKHHLACHIRSRAHLEMMQNCSKLGITIPPELDPDHPTPSSANMPVEETVLAAGPNFETHIAEMDDEDESERVLIFQPCQDIEPYIIQESEEVVVV